MKNLKGNIGNFFWKFVFTQGYLAMSECAYAVLPQRGVCVRGSKARRVCVSKEGCYELWVN